MFVAEHAQSQTIEPGSACQAGGVGLTLTAATHVIHFDRQYNPAKENQAAHSPEVWLQSAMWERLLAGNRSSSPHWSKEDGVCASPCEQGAFTTSSFPHLSNLISAIGFLKL